MSAHAWSILPAARDDVQDLAAMIRGLAEYERLAHENIVCHRERSTTTE